MRRARADLKDSRGGAYETNTSNAPDKAAQPSRDYDQAQVGTGVRQKSQNGDQELPEGLTRQRKGPLGPNNGRRGGNI